MHCPTCGRGGEPTTGADTPLDGCDCQPHCARIVCAVETDGGVILWIDGERYDSANGQPFFFASIAGALRTAAEEQELIEKYGRPTTTDADDEEDLPYDERIARANAYADETAQRDAAGQGPVEIEEATASVRVPTGRGRGQS